MRLQTNADLTPELLSELLAEVGVLRAGAVRSVTLIMESRQKGFVSDVATFQITYSSEANADAPGSIFLKRTKPDLHTEYRDLGQHEIAFYTALALNRNLPIPNCYYAQWDEPGQQAILLLEDLSTTYRQRPLPLPPAPTECVKIVESLAHVHAQWWNDPQLGISVGRVPTQSEVDGSTARLYASVPHFMDVLGEVLLPNQRAAYERILGSNFLKRRGERLLSRHNLSLIHGDAHTNNIMLPRAEGQAMLIDWHRWAIEVPLFDLAFLIALHWTAERRAALEQPLIRRYHGCLQQHGVSNYSWEMCWNDYREMVTTVALIPIGQLRRGMPMGVVWYGLEQSIAAFNDLGCDELC